MSDVLQRVYRIAIPDSQTVLVVPAHNAHPMRDLEEQSDWLQSIENEGWRWVGQRAKNWFADGAWTTEYYDVFQRTKHHE